MNYTITPALIKIKINQILPIRLLCVSVIFLTFIAICLKCLPSGWGQKTIGSGRLCWLIALKGTLLSLDNPNYEQIKTCFREDMLTEMEKREHMKDRLERYDNFLAPGGRWSRTLYLLNCPLKHLRLLLILAVGGHW